MDKSGIRDQNDRTDKFFLAFSINVSDNGDSSERSVRDLVRTPPTREGSIRIGVEADRAMKNRGIKTLRHDNRQELPRITNKHSLSFAQWLAQWGPVFAHAYDVLWEKSGNVCFYPSFPRLVAFSSLHWLAFIFLPSTTFTLNPLGLTLCLPDFSSFFLPEKAQCRNYRILRILIILTFWLSGFLMLKFLKISRSSSYLHVLELHFSSIYLNIKTLILNC